MRGKRLNASVLVYLCLNRLFWLPVFFPPLRPLLLRLGCWQLEFYRFWTLKESYIKALGIGLRMDLQRLQFISDTRLAAGCHSQAQQDEDKEEDARGEGERAGEEEDGHKGKKGKQQQHHKHNSP